MLKAYPKKLQVIDYVTIREAVKSGVYNLRPAGSMWHPLPLVAAPILLTQLITQASLCRTIVSPHYSNMNEII